MADIDLGTLAGTVGIPVETFRNGIGVVLNFLKGSLPAGLFGQVQEKVPEAQGMMDAAAKTPEATGGILGAVVGAAGKALSHIGGAGALLSKLSALGLSLEQITAFLPKVLEFMKAYLPADLLAKVIAAVKKEA